MILQAVLYNFTVLYDFTVLSSFFDIRTKVHKELA